VTVVAARVITAQIGADAFVVSAAGELDLASHEVLDRELTGAIDRGCRRLIVDLTGVTFIDSAAMGALVVNARRLPDDGGCVVVADDPRILRVFEITGLDRTFEIERSLAEGVDRLVGRIARA
jgi:anti-sigma B factor antagonist